MNNDMSEAQKQAFEYSVTEGDNEAPIWGVLKYLVRLHELEPDAITVQPPRETDGDCVRFIYPDMYENEESEELETEPGALELKILCPHPQKEAADICQVSVRTLQRWGKRGLPSIRVNGQVLYDDDELRAFMEMIGHVPGFQRLGNGNQRMKQ